ncbi:MAG: peptidase [Bryobacterales bacterium]|nr:peptidase [Bryobacterales bacterium]
MKCLIARASAGIAMLLICLPLLAQENKVDRVLSELDEVKPPSDVSISPDGKWVTWSERASSGDGTSIYLLLNRAAADARPDKLTVPNQKEPTHQRGVSWSPDSSQIAFLATAGSDQEQVYVMGIADRKVRELTNLTGYVTDVRWSPDGSRLSFLYAENGGGAGPLAAAPAQLGEIGSAIHNQRLTVMNAQGGAIRAVTPAELNIYEYDWAPDGKHFAATAAPGPADNNWWIAKLYSVDEASGQMQVLYTPPVQRQLAFPRWSPDGKTVAFIGGLMSDQGFTGGDVLTIAGNGGPVQNHTNGKRFSVSSLKWQTDTRLAFTAVFNGSGEIGTLQLPDNETEILWKGPQGVHEGGNYPNFAFAADAKTSALVRSTWQEVPDVWAGPVGSWQQLTHLNVGQKPHWGKAESITWQSGGFAVQGWLLYPENFDPAKRYPMVVEIHGGPAGAREASWPSSHFDMSVLSGLGYFVFFPNPRGSYGGGEAFTRANVKDFGGGDLRDIMAGVDAVLKKAPVDPARLGVTGWSYGGFMTMWTITQTHRFRAAVAGAGIADWLSYYGENGIDEWMIPYFGASVYDNPAVYARSAPITFIKNVKTPTLVVVGERDAECPSPQSFEFWHALDTLKIPTKLVVYPGEGHSFHDPNDRRDVVRRAASWFEKYLSPTEATTTASR